MISGKSIRTPAVKSVLVAAIACLSWFGCNKGTASAPVPLPLEQIAPAVTQAFSKSDKETQDQVSDYATAIAKRDFGAAFESMQVLVHKPGLTADQRALLARASMTTSQKLQEAAAGGDQNANDALKSYSATK